MPNCAPVSLRCSSQAARTGHELHIALASFMALDTSPLRGKNGSKPSLCFGALAQMASRIQSVVTSRNPTLGFGLV